MLPVVRCQQKDLACRQINKLESDSTAVMFTNTRLYKSLIPPLLSVVAGPGRELSVLGEGKGTMADTGTGLDIHNIQAAGVASRRCQLGSSTRRQEQ